MPRSAAPALARTAPAAAPRRDPGGTSLPVWTSERVDFDATFRRLYPSLHRYLYRLTGDGDAADDIAQEAFVRLLTRPMPEEEARLWLFTVATNLFRDGARTSRRRERLLTASPPRVATFPRPDEQAERGQEVARVRAALELIPPRERQMLLMREEGFRYDEIARAAGVAPGSVGTLLARALRKFAAAYDAPLEEEV